jgi:hypothetical protein
MIDYQTDTSSFKFFIKDHDYYDDIEKGREEFRKIKKNKSKINAVFTINQIEQLVNHYTY